MRHAPSSGTEPRRSPGLRYVSNCAQPATPKIPSQRQRKPKRFGERGRGQRDDEWESWERWGKFCRRCFSLLLTAWCLLGMWIISPKFYRTVPHKNRAFTTCANSVGSKKMICYCTKKTEAVKKNTQHRRKSILGSNRSSHYQTTGVVSVQSSVLLWSYKQAWRYRPWNPALHNNGVTSQDQVTPLISRWHGATMHITGDKDDIGPVGRSVTVKDS